MGDPTIPPKNPSYPDPTKPPKGSPEWFMPQHYDLKKMFPFVVAGLVVILIAEIGINYFEKKTNYKPLTEISNQNAFNKNELNGFPVYPQSVYVTKKKQAGSTVYSWTSADNYDQISSWYRSDKSKSGWKCEGGAGQYDNARSANGTTACRKNGLTYALTLYTHTSQTELAVTVPDRK